MAEERQNCLVPLHQVQVSVIDPQLCMLSDHLPSFLWLSWLSKRGKRTATMSSEHLPKQVARRMEQWYQTQRGTLSNFPFHCWLCTKEERLWYLLHFLIKIIITWVWFFFKIRKKNLKRPAWMTFCRTFLSPFSLEQWRICQSSYWERRADEPKD